VLGLHERTTGSKIVSDTPDRNTLVRWVLWNLISVRLETLLVSVQGKGIVCAKRTIGSEIIFDALDGTPR
jgi:hypothetical protein